MGGKNDSRTTPVQRTLVLALSLALLVGPAFVAPAAADASEEARLLVGFLTLPEEVEPGSTYHGAEVVETLDRIHVALVRTDDPAAFREEAAQDDRVVYVEEDETRSWALMTPNDTYYGTYQYNIEQVRLDEAWDDELGSTSITVCVVDTGLRSSHEDISGARLVGQRDFVNNDGNAFDDNGHGTFVTGIAAAITNNGKGIAGAAQVGVLAAKALDHQGSGSLSGVASAIDWCASNGAHVINLSLGCAGCDSSTLKRAVDDAYHGGALVVAAAGNDGPCSNCIAYPAAYSTAIAVTGTREGGGQWSGTSDGPEAELAAPAQDIAGPYASSNTAYVVGSGTSAAAPLVSGVAAVTLSENPGMATTDLRQALRDTAQDAGSSGWDQQYGYGIVDARALLDLALLPVAAFTVSCTDLDCALDGTDSSDPQNDPLSYSWTLGDGNTDTGAVVSHTYAAEGTYNVCLTVSDGTDTDSLCKDVVARFGPDLIATDPRGDASSLTIWGNVYELDLIRLEGEPSNDGGLTFHVTLDRLNRLFPDPFEAAQGMTWVVQWTNPLGGMDYVSLTTGYLGYDCDYGAYTGLTYNRQGEAPCSVALGTPGVITLTFPEDALSDRGYSNSDALQDVFARSQVFRGSPPDVLAIGALQTYDETTPADWQP